MNVSRHWLSKFFEAELPSSSALAEALTFHAFEVESVEGDVIDVKVTPNRGHDCLSHRGIAKELSAILKIPLAHDPFMTSVSLEKKTNDVSVSLESSLCKRYIAGYVKGIKVGPSPKWLKHNLEAIGQRSINNVVDATNFVMFNVGQPLHAFDADKLSRKDGRYAIVVRNAREGERFVGLDAKEYALCHSMLVIGDGNSGEVIGVAGVKGGLPAGITEETRDIIVESANFDGPSVRRTAAALKLRTDASIRFEQVLSPELAAHGMEGLLEFIAYLLGGEAIGFVDMYPVPEKNAPVSVTLAHLNHLLGLSCTGAEVADVFTRLGLPFKEEHEAFTVSPPFERLDLTIAEDLIEEVGRILGYERIPAVPLSLGLTTSVNPNFSRAEFIRKFLQSRGFSEVYTSVFSEKGERVVRNKVDGVRPYLRSNLSEELAEALERNVRNKELLGLAQVKLFEIGTVWKGGVEEETYSIAVEKVKGKKNAEEYTKELDHALALRISSSRYEDVPVSAAVRYQPFSRYPYMVRDVALWTPEGTNTDRVMALLKREAGPLCVRINLFDTFKKDGKVSHAYRLIFQSFDRTLTEEEVNLLMGRVYNALQHEGFQTR